MSCVTLHRQFPYTRTSFHCCICFYSQFRCGERELCDSFLKRFEFFMLVIFGGIKFYMRIARDKIKRLLHLCPRGRERISRPGRG